MNFKRGSDPSHFERIVTGPGADIFSLRTLYYPTKVCQYRPLELPFDASC